jgi:hypothetical protein
MELGPSQLPVVGREQGAELVQLLHLVTDDGDMASSLLSTPQDSRTGAPSVPGGVGGVGFALRHELRRAVNGAHLVPVAHEDRASMCTRRTGGNGLP